MDDTAICPTAGELDLRTILDAWNTATERLQQTHGLLRDEVKRLTDELELKNSELAHKNRLADLGQMASHVAHEVRNGLVPMKLYLSLLKRRISADTGAVEIVDKIGSGFTALESVVNDLLHFASHRDPHLASCDVNELVEEICDSLLPRLESDQITAELTFAEPAHIVGDKDMLRRAILNLILNALEAMPTGGRLEITGTHGDDGYEIEIADSGHGLSDDAAERMFEPFFTTKSGGTGLGLAIVYRIAQVHGGSVSARNCPSGGAAFTLRFPSQGPATQTNRRFAA